MTNETKHTPGPWHTGITSFGNPFVRSDKKNIADTWAYAMTPEEQAANTTLIAAAPRMATELTRGRATLCALRYWLPGDLLPAVNRVIANMADAIGEATGDCPPETDGRTEKAARAAIEEATK